MKWLMVLLALAAYRGDAGRTNKNRQRDAALEQDVEDRSQDAQHVEGPPVQDDNKDPDTLEKYTETASGKEYLYNEDDFKADPVGFLKAHPYAVTEEGNRTCPNGYTFSGKTVCEKASDKMGMTFRGTDHEFADVQIGCISKGGQVWYNREGNEDDILPALDGGQFRSVCALKAKTLDDALWAEASENAKRVEKGGGDESGILHKPITHKVLNQIKVSSYHQDSLVHFTDFHYAGVPGAWPEERLRTGCCSTDFQEPFELQKGEYISAIQGGQGGHLDGIMFTTNKGRTSPQYGQPGGDPYAVFASKGKQIVGLEREANPAECLAWRSPGPRRSAPGQKRCSGVITAVLECDIGEPSREKVAQDKAEDLDKIALEEFNRQMDNEKDKLGVLHKPAEGCQDKVLDYVALMSGAAIDFVGFHYGKKTKLRTGGGGAGQWQEPFKLQEDETISAIHGGQGDMLDSIRFTSDKGRQSKRYGGDGGDPYSIKASPGKQIVGLERKEGIAGAITAVLECDRTSQTPPVEVAKDALTQLTHEKDALLLKMAENKTKLKELEDKIAFEELDNAQEVCTHTNDGRWDKNLKDCDFYDRNQEYCGQEDTDKNTGGQRFAAKEMCCACGGGIKEGKKDKWLREKAAECLKGAGNKYTVVTKGNKFTAEENFNRGSFKDFECPEPCGRCCGYNKESGGTRFKCFPKIETIGNVPHATNSQEKTYSKLTELKNESIYTSKCGYRKQNCIIENGVLACDDYLGYFHEHTCATPDAI